MDPNIDKNINTQNRSILFLKENKLKIFSVLIVIILIILVVIFIQFKKQKNSNLISEKYIHAGLLLSSGDTEKSKNLLEEIILSKHNFYSILALNTILEKKLEKNKSKVILHFEIVENLNNSQDQKDLITFKKALYLIESSEKKEGEQLLNNLILSDSKLKSLAKEVLEK
jgi:predicted negative regulator of RcsB-dependent stress response